MRVRSTRVLTFPGGFIDRYDAAHVQCGVAFLIVSREELGLRMHHLQFAAVRVELDLAEEGDARSGREPVGQISAVEPLAEQDGA